MLKDMLIPGGDTDPYRSFMWEYRKNDLLGTKHPAIFDSRVMVLAPPFAEDPFQVPLLVDATGLDAWVEKIVVFVDYGPIPRILTFHPGVAEARLSLRFKIDQATAVRAAALTGQGTWHVGSAWVDAGGGGCSAPAIAYASDDWRERLGQARGALWPGTGRARVLVNHPMDTGLADGIPVFIITELILSSPAGSVLSRIELDEPVGEDPVFTWYFRPGTLPTEAYVSGRDTNGNLIAATLRAKPGLVRKGTGP